MYVIESHHIGAKKHNLIKVKYGASFGNSSTEVARENLYGLPKHSSELSVKLNTMMLSAQGLLLMSRLTTDPTYGQEEHDMH
jgi:hypothetical protein